MSKVTIDLKMVTNLVLLYFLSFGVCQNIHYGQNNIRSDPFNHFDDSKDPSRDEESYHGSKKQIFNKISRRQRVASISEDVIAYSLDQLSSCRQPPLKIQNFCRDNSSVPAFLLSKNARKLDQFIDNYVVIEKQLGSNSICSRYFKEILCQSNLPKCSSDRQSIMIGNIKQCRQFSHQCRNSGIQLNRYCNVSVSNYTLARCVKPPFNSFGIDECSDLPANMTFPEWMIPNLLRQSKSIASLKSILNTARVSKDCSTGILSLACHEIPFCSADSTMLLSAITKQECRKAKACLPEAIKVIIGSILDCEIFPDSSAKTIKYYKNGC
ncbi:uncharacterized protein TRIADDRAFT_54733 [Trichoplax adhaerens]|uniref:FZ domain-containing protein n=1 Tax=Trichoplax adhaerens TaxID=10228 RepID=B3RSU5_TRIAD|nr:predicted protein [Trichoplax adhaerens]EDV27106.1 predicted protein [Trichoplax adhaerens]|eukprot:XP_002111102.1 predicted protein [Trichoplax adhaerens]